MIDAAYSMHLIISIISTCALDRAKNTLAIEKNRTMMLMCVSLTQYCRTLSRHLQPHVQRVCVDVQRGKKLVEFPLSLSLPGFATDLSDFFSPLVFPFNSLERSCLRRQKR